MSPANRAFRHPWLPALVLAVTAFLAHAAWLGWDHTYQQDPVTGLTSGPYEAWQVAGCVVTLAVASVVAGARHHPWLALAIIPAVFTLIWSIPAAQSDESGLWAVGALLILFGTAGGTAATTFLAHALSGRLRG